MEKVRVIILEDEFEIGEDIRMSLERDDYHVLSVYDRAEIALPQILDQIPDILLVDIKLAGSMNGIELVQIVLREMLIPIIYITANSDRSTYELAKATRPHAFLIKPFTSQNLIASIDIALNNFSMNMKVEKIERAVSTSPWQPVVIHQCMFIRTNGMFRKINCCDILFAEASGSYVHIQTTDQRYTLSQNLAQFQRKTPMPFLIKIHRSFLVNVNQVDSFEESFIFIRNYKLPLSESHRSEFLKHIRCI